jgi:hypothetical protein
MQTHFAKLLGTGLLSVSLAVLPLTLAGNAQTTQGQTDTVQTDPVQTTQTEQDRDFDWGWLGLLGLIGLAGFAAKRQGEPTHYRSTVEDPDIANRPGNRY